MLELLTKYWKPVAIAATIVVIFGTGYYKGYQHEKLKFEEHLAGDARLMAVAKAVNDRQIKEANIITENVTKEYADAVSKINSYYKSHPSVVRLCSNTDTTNPVSSKGQSAEGASPTTPRIAETVTEIDLAIAAKEIKQCQLLIEFENRQDEVQ